VSVYFASTHRGKKSLTLNLKDPAGVEALLRLAETADVFVESFRPGVVDRLGVSYQAVSERAPGIVYASISAFGQNGPYAGIPAHDLAVQAMSGALSANLGPDNQPVLPGVLSADMLASSMALSGVLMALLRRQSTGKGDYVDIAMMDALLASMPINLSSPLAENRQPVPKEERLWGGSALYQVYETKDGRLVALGGFEIKFATNLLTALERPDLIPLCKLPAGEPQKPVRDFLTTTFLEKTQAEWVDWMADKDVAFAPVKTLPEGLADSQTRHREMVIQDVRGWKHIGTPLKFTNELPQLHFTPPTLGQHSEEILRALGYGDQDLKAMKAAGTY
ncbi:MAG: CaiB/BaiF CoA-transferase family protein, partial [Pseudomonadota bacterium]